VAGTLAGRSGRRGGVATGVWENGRRRSVIQYIVLDEPLGVGAGKALEERIGCMLAEVAW